jgi:phosphopantothenoylcysteine decarboxylase/phosphopantothenate--cysteine ligase
MASSFEGREIVLGVSAGVAAYKAAALTSLLVQQGAGVTAVLTPRARRFVGAATFAALTGRPVASRSFDPAAFPLGAHIELAARADVVVVAPASADLLAKAATGAANDLLSTLLLCAECPVLFAPAMNAAMWAHPAVQRNVAQLAADGATIVAPGTGWLSCRRQGAGRMAEPEEIALVIGTTLAGRT